MYPYFTLVSYLLSVPFLSPFVPWSHFCIQSFQPSRSLSLSLSPSVSACLSVGAAARAQVETHTANILTAERAARDSSSPPSPSVTFFSARRDAKQEGFITAATTIIINRHPHLREREREAAALRGLKKLRKIGFIKGAPEGLVPGVNAG